MSLQHNQARLLGPGRNARHLLVRLKKHFESLLQPARSMHELVTEDNVQAMQVGPAPSGGIESN
jgi:hypothetical protein